MDVTMRGTTVRCLLHNEHHRRLPFLTRPPVRPPARDAQHPHNKRTVNLLTPVVELLNTLVPADVATLAACTEAELDQIGEAS